MRHLANGSVIAPDATPGGSPRQQGICAPQEVSVFGAWIGRMTLKPRRLNVMTSIPPPQTLFVCQGQLDCWASRIGAGNTDRPKVLAEEAREMEGSDEKAH